MLEMHPVNYTNDPYSAGQNDNLIAINATLQVDFLGQCASESLGAVPYSGTGGQTDFVRAGNRSYGGKSFIVLPSTAKDDTISRIQPCLTEGGARHHRQERCRLRGYRIRRGPVARPIEQTARQGVDCDCPSEISR